MKIETMKTSLRATFYGIILGAVIPLLLIIPLSLLNYFGSNSSVLLFISLSSILPISFYHFASFKAMQDGSEFTILLSIAFYLNFIIFMIAVLIAFNFIIIGGFLFGGDSPIGMDLNAEQAPYLVGLGLYLIIISACGMYYVSQAKKQILS